MSKFIQIVAVKDDTSECLYALDDEGEVWWRDVSESCQDGEPWTKTNAKRSRETLREALTGDVPISALATDLADLERVARGMRFHLGDRVEIRVQHESGMREVVVDERFELTRGFAVQIGSAFMLAAGELTGEHESAEEREEFVCVGCGARFLHPVTGENCPSGRGGWCGHLTGEGWRAVRIQVSTEETPRKLFSGGAWICTKCAKRYEYNAPTPRRKRGRK